MELGSMDLGLNSALRLTTELIHKVFVGHLLPCDVLVLASCCAIVAREFTTVGACHTYWLSEWCVGSHVCELRGARLNMSLRGRPIVVEVEVFAVDQGCLLIDVVDKV